MNFDLFTYLTSVAFIYVYGRMAIHYLPWVLNYILNEPFNWQSKLEKPRILLHLLGLSFMHLLYYSHNSIENKGIFFQIIISVTFSFAFLVCYFSWTEKFQVSFKPQLKNNAPRSSENFNLSISEIQLVQLYNEMVRYDLLSTERTSLLDFKKVLTDNWDSHNSKIYFKMDGPSCREFYEFLVKTFPKNSLSLKNFFNSSKLIVRPDGKTYNYNTIKNAPTRSSYSKRHSDLNLIFQKFS
ncbi:hypothetical protein [Gillisia limnaea]|uniref:Uncharacterized protein n=1 Tax=Gillisia limnaea (strain DSM 15749 / LMG 21470 / R-8282) TaxID=865937 RepID=H2BW70_GILLR|nr:hypothetical protein [Gillisia limnaea]EHQ04034.1 hypothetical protein Gilli_3435 [Gillisia limnaea DSM 15749]